MQPDEPIEHELLRNAVVADVTVTNTEVNAPRPATAT